LKKKCTLSVRRVLKSSFSSPLRTEFLLNDGFDSFSSLFLIVSTPLSVRSDPPFVWRRNLSSPPSHTLSGKSFLFPFHRVYYRSLCLLQIFQPLSHLFLSRAFFFNTTFPSLLFLSFPPPLPPPLLRPLLSFPFIPSLHSSVLVRPVVLVIPLPLYSSQSLQSSGSFDVVPLLLSTVQPSFLRFL